MEKAPRSRANETAIPTKVGESAIEHLGENHFSHADRYTMTARPP